MPQQPISEPAEVQCDGRIGRAVYTLSDPRSGEIRYVGKTVGTVGRRLARHLSPCELRGDSHKERWIRSLLGIGLRPTITVVEHCDSGDGLCEREVHWIAHYRSLGCDLTNATPGGDRGGGPCTPEAREKIRAALLGAPKSVEHRAKCSQWQRGRKLPPQTIAKMRGRKASAEAKARMRLAQQGHPNYVTTREAKLSISRSKGGRPIVDQHGTRYEMQVDAVRSLGISRGHLNEVLHGKRKHVAGYVFRFVDAE